MGAKSEGFLAHKHNCGGGGNAGGVRARGRASGPARKGGARGAGLRACAREGRMWERMRARSPRASGGAHEPAVKKGPPLLMQVHPSRPQNFCPQYQCRPLACPHCLDAREGLKLLPRARSDNVWTEVRRGPRTQSRHRRARVCASLSDAQRNRTLTSCAGAEPNRLPTSVVSHCAGHVPVSFAQRLHNPSVDFGRIRHGFVLTGLSFEHTHTNTQAGECRPSLWWPRPTLDHFDGFHQAWSISGQICNGPSLKVDNPL